MDDAIRDKLYTAVPALSDAYHSQEGNVATLCPTATYSSRRRLHTQHPFLKVAIEMM
jgi:hypothetical protein